MLKLIQTQKLTDSLMLMLIQTQRPIDFTDTGFRRWILIDLLTLKSMQMPRPIDSLTLMLTRCRD